jgi:2-isopropylmalate synthase
LETLGYRLTDAELKVVFKDFKDLADRKKNIYDEDLHTLVGSSATAVDAYYELTSVEFNGGSSVEPGATVTMNVNGSEVSAHSSGDGPVNAALEAVKRCAGLDNVTLLDYSISAITGGSDAQGRVNVRIDSDGEHFQGQSTDTDVVVASAEAFVSALNRAAWRRDNPKVSAQAADKKREAS